MTRTRAPVSLLLCFAAASPSLAADCEADARAAMLNVSHPVPMRQDVTTEMAGQSMKSAALSTPDRTGMALDAAGRPVSLWQPGRFYASSDGGQSWSLVRSQSADEVAAQDEALRTQADRATDIMCEYGTTLDGRSVNRFRLSYVMIPAGTAVQSTYWVDVENGFPWKVVHKFGGTVPSTITQLNTPELGLTIPDPDG